jgi:hypothetical protein
MCSVISVLLRDNCVVVTKVGLKGATLFALILVAIF